MKEKDTTYLERRGKGRLMVGTAEGKFGSVYDIESDKEGLPGFYNGIVTMYFSGTAVKGKAKARGSHRAILLAMLDVVNQGLAFFPPETPE